MALLFHNGTTVENVLGAQTIDATNANLSTTPLLGVAVTAPNTSNAATGIFFFIATVPTSGDITIELMQSGVSVKSVQVNRTDCQVGWNYARFTTPFTFTTTAAGAYAGRITKTTGTNGVVARQGGGSLAALYITYDTSVTPGVGDDVIFCGWHDSGLTTKTWTITGTSTSFGSGLDKSMVSTTSRTIGAALTIGNGATVNFDTSANATLQVRGTVQTTMGGYYLQNANASDITKVATLIIDCDTADGNYGLLTCSGSLGGTIETTGMVVSPNAQYASGLGTAASPVVTTAAHGFDVDYELVFGGATDYLKNEVRYVISVPSPTELVLSTSIGGAEVALAQTHAANSWIGNLTRNCIVKAQNISRGFWVFNSTTSAADTCDFSYARYEYPCCLSGKGIQPNTTVSVTDMDGFVLYNNSAAARTSIGLGNRLPQTINDMILYNTRGTNYSGQSGLALTGVSNKVINRLLHFADPSGATNAAGISLSTSATGNTINDFHSYGGNASNASLGYALGIFSSSGNVFNDCSINASRSRGMVWDNALGNTFNNCDFGSAGTNTIDLLVNTDTLNTGVFNDCSFASATLVSNYLNTLDGTDIAFQNMDGSTSKHRWYTNKGSFWSSGSGLTDTTVRTAASLALAIKPENATDGAVMTFKVPANPTSNVLVYGYLYRNATFSSGTLKVDLFLPGTLLTGTPDATVTLATTTGSWLPWVLNAYYSGSVARYATVKVTAVTSTAGAYAFLDDLYDAGTGNKVAGLDLWDAGKISPVIAAFDYSSIPEQTRLAVWSDTDTYGTGEKGKLLADIPTANANADALLDREDAIEAGWTMRQVTRIMAAVLGGKVSGATGGAGIETFRSISDGKDRVTATVDANGNRTSITLDKT